MITLQLGCTFVDACLNACAQIHNGLLHARSVNTNTPASRTAENRETRGHVIVVVTTIAFIYFTNDCKMGVTLPVLDSRIGIILLPSNQTQGCEFSLHIKLRQINLGFAKLANFPIYSLFDSLQLKPTFLRTIPCEISSKLHVG